MHILSAEQMRQADACTIQQEPIASINLMERASKACFDWMRKTIDRHTPIKVFCGTGNNGGDGLAIARMLALSGYSVVAYKICLSENFSADFITNEKRLRKVKKAQQETLHPGDKLPEIKPEDVLIDAIFGTGLNRPLESFAKTIVEHMNQAQARIISIDMPSGLFSEDNTPNPSGGIIRAHHTLSFQLPKLAFMFADNHPYTGNWTILDIGLNKEFISTQETPWHFVTAPEVKVKGLSRLKHDHKGTYGHGLLIAGSYGKGGAAILSAKACLRSGAGLLTVYTPGINYGPMQTAVPEAMVMGSAEQDYISGLPDISRYTAIAAGPGLGMQKATANMLKLLIQNSPRPLVLDADALNILSENPTWLAFLPKGSILTPHPGEWERLAGKSLSGYEQLQRARDFAFRYQIYIVLKGAHTAIVTPERQCYFNSTGNPGMATAGSGDVLTGTILGLLTRGYSPLISAIMGVYIHGLAGDLAARNRGMESLIAGDLLEYLPKSFRKAL